MASCVACSKRYPVVTQFFIVTFTTGLYFMSAIFFFGDAEEGEMAPLEAIYFAVVTMSTVGYGDITPKSDQTRIFTIFIMVFSSGMFGYVMNKIAIIFQLSLLN